MGVVAGPRFGRFETLALENERLRLVLVPTLGARVISLVDRSTGRDWLVRGEPPSPAGAEAWAAPDAVFGGPQAFGWDECLPTVAPCPDPLDPLGSPLRDHGDQWGRPADVRPRPDGAIVASWTAPARYAFRRALRLDGTAVEVRYTVESLGPDLPFLWSMHPLLALEPGTRIELPGIERLRVSHATGLHLATTGGGVDWPIARRADGSTVDLSLVPPVGAGLALKLAGDAPPAGPVRARQPDGSSLAIGWDRAFAPSLGLWLDAGGWPAGEGRHQVALEPATAPTDDLSDAIRDRRSIRLGGRERREWWVRLLLDGPAGSRPH